MLDTILRRRTTRKFLTKEVADDTIVQLVQMAMFAPTRLGRRPWHFVIIRRPEIKRTLAERLRIEPDMVEAPAWVAVVADRKLTDAWDLDGAAATENLMIAATAMGLGTAWIAAPVGPVWNKIDEVVGEAVRAPKDMGLVALIAVGHAAEPAPAKKPEDVYEQHRVHFERWGNTRG